jgi:quercetin dioxygenase-like cupin family protein
MAVLECKMPLLGAITLIGGFAMQLFAWDSVRKEQMNPRIWRKVVTGEKMTVAQIFIAKDGVVPVHHHENEQMSYVLEGALKFDIGGQEVIVRKGEIVHIPSNVPHGVVALEDTFDIEIFAPVRTDWLSGQDDYLRKG